MQGAATTASAPSAPKPQADQPLQGTAAQPFMIDVSRPPAERESLPNVIVGAFGLTGAIVLGAIVSGVALSSVWIAWRRWRRTYDVDAPPSLGSVALDPGGLESDGSATRPPSSPDQ